MALQSGSVDSRINFAAAEVPAVYGPTPSSHSGIFWFRPAANSIPSGNRRIFSVRRSGPADNLFIQGLSNGSVRVRIDNGTAIITSVVGPDFWVAEEWHLIVYTWQNGPKTANIYVINESKTIVTDDDTDATGGFVTLDGFAIGAGGTSDCWQGEYGPFFIVDPVLDADDVNAIWQSGSPNLFGLIASGVVSETDIVAVYNYGPRTDGDGDPALIGDAVTAGNYHAYIRAGTPDWRGDFSRDANATSASGGGDAFSYIDPLDTAEDYGNFFARQVQDRPEASVSGRAPRMRGVANGVPPGLLRLGIFDFSDCASRDDADHATIAGNVWCGLIGATLPNGGDFIAQVAGVGNVPIVDTEVRYHGFDMSTAPFEAGAPSPMGGMRAGWKAWSVAGEAGTRLADNDGIAMLCGPIAGSKLIASQALRYRAHYLAAPYAAEGVDVNLEWRTEHSTAQGTPGTLGTLQTETGVNTAIASHSWGASDTWDGGTRTMVLDSTTGLGLTAGVDYVHLEDNTGGHDNTRELYRIVSVSEIGGNTTIVLEHAFTTDPLTTDELFFGPAERRTVEATIDGGTSDFRGLRLVADAASGGFIIVIAADAWNPNAGTGVIVSGHGDGGVQFDEIFEGNFDAHLDTAGRQTFFQNLNLDIALLYPGIDPGEAEAGDGTQVHLIDDAVAAAMPNCERVWICRPDGIRVGNVVQDDFSTPNQYASDNAAAAGVPFLAFAQSAPIGIGEENCVRGFISDLRHPTQVGAEHNMTAMLAQAATFCLPGRGLRARPKRERSRVRYA